MRRFALITLLVSFVMPATAFAQGSRKDDIVLNRLGQPVAGASVTVCTSGATGTPCSPKASLFSDVALTQPLANPLTTDGQGNYHFYAAPGRYLIQFSGAGVAATTLADVLLPADPTTPSFQSLNVAQNISALNLSLAGNLTVNGGVSSPSTLSAPQQGSAAPVQIGPHWYAGTASGLCSVPAAPNVTTETASSGTGNFSSATTYYVKVALYNRNGATSASPATAYTPASGSTNRMLVQLSDLSYRSGCYGFRVYVSSTGINGTYFPAQAWTLPGASFASLTRAANGVVTAVTASAHGFIPGESITVSGVAGGATSFNGTFTLIGQQVSSPTTLFWFQSGAAESATPGTGTGTVIAGLGGDTFGHFAPGDFIVATAPASGAPPPSTNTATIDPMQVALNATCSYAANACAAGGYDAPQGVTSLTTPLIVSNQQTVAGVNAAVAGGKSEISCSWKDPNLGCVMVMGTANGVRIEGLDVESAGHGLMLAGWGPGYANFGQHVRSNTIVSSDTTGQYSAIYFHHGVFYNEHFENNFLQGGLAAVQMDAISGGWWFFSGSRWNVSNLHSAGLNTNALLSVSSASDPDRGIVNTAFPNGASMVHVSNLFSESATGVQFDATNLGLHLQNVLTADPNANAGTPAIVRVGSDANSHGGNFTDGAVIADSYFQPAANGGAMVQLIGNDSNLFTGLALRNAVGGQTNAVDMNNVSICVTSYTSTLDPYENASINRVINIPATGCQPKVEATSINAAGEPAYWLPAAIRFHSGQNSGGLDWYLHWIGTNHVGWYNGDYATASNAWMDWAFASGGRFRLWQNDGATPLFDVNAAAGANQINLCNPSSPANNRVTLGCPLADSAGAIVKGALTGATGSLGGSALAAGACSGTTATISGATTAMAVVASPAADPGAGFYWPAFVSAANTVTVRVCAAAAGTPSASTYNVRVIQ